MIKVDIILDFTNFFLIFASELMILMRTTHRLFFNPAQDMSAIADASVNEIITSPPYPMIEMWDGILASQNATFGEALHNGSVDVAFEAAHQELDKVWKECYRVLSPGGFLCINIGDATRTIKGEFRLFNNHSRIVKACLELGYNNLPNIIWRKQTNAPNKFMGSGMLPCGAYVTLEHEYILIFRKGSKREYKKEELKLARKNSAFFWEERNVWFSDVWDLKGTKQKITNTETRDRSAAYPFEVPYRLINMYSQYGDTVLDPFFGLGTTMLAAMASGRNSIGFEIDDKLKSSIEDNLKSFSITDFNNVIKNRFDKHAEFVKARFSEKGPLKHSNNNLGSDVMTSQEEELEFHYLTQIEGPRKKDTLAIVTYEDTSDINNPPKPEGVLF